MCAELFPSRLWGFGSKAKSKAKKNRFCPGPFTPVAHATLRVNRTDTDPGTLLHFFAFLKQKMYMYIYIYMVP